MLEDPRSGRTRGRQNEARENDGRILAAALEVLSANPNAPIAAIADRAGVGVASLYRRFSGRDELVRQLSLSAMSAIERQAVNALALVEETPLQAFTGFVLNAMRAGAGAMSAFAGTFEPGDELNEAGNRLAVRIQELLKRAQHAGAVHPELTSLDVMQLFEMLRAVNVGDVARSQRLRVRYLELLTPGLSAQTAVSLSEPPPTWAEILEVWNP